MPGRRRDLEVRSRDPVLRSDWRVADPARYLLGEPGGGWGLRPVTADQSTKFEARADVCKVDAGLGLVFGWGMICTEDGQPYYDVQGDHIPETAMLEAAADFMVKSRVSGDMHRADDGVTVFMFPLTAEIAKAFGIETRRTGALLAVKPSAEVLGKFRDGTYTGFSIGGRRGEEEVVEW